MKKPIKKLKFTPKLGDEITLLEVERERKKIEKTGNDMIKDIFYDCYLPKFLYN